MQCVLRRARKLETPSESIRHPKAIGDMFSGRLTGVKKGGGFVTEPLSVDTSGESGPRGEDGGVGIMVLLDEFQRLVGC